MLLLYSIATLTTSFQQYNTHKYKLLDWDTKMSVKKFVLLATELFQDEGKYGIELVTISVINRSEGN